MKKLDISLILISIGTPIVIIPIVLEYLFDLDLTKKLAIFVLFSILTSIFSGINYLSFIALFIYSILPRSERITYLFSALGLLLVLFIPIKILTFQLLIFVAGFLLLFVLLMPDIVARLFPSPKPRSREEIEMELWRRLKEWK